MVGLRAAIFRSVIFISILLCLPVTATEVDTKLEQALDRYIQLIDKDDEQAANNLLQQLAETNIETPAIQSRVRLLSYLLTEAFDFNDQAKTNVLLQQLLQLSEATENANALAEIYATELELLLLQNKLDDAIIKADLLERVLLSATDLRQRYYGHNVLGRLYKADSQYEQALQHFISAMDIVAQTDDSFTLRRRAFLNFNIAHVHAELKNWPQAAQLAEELVNDAIKYKNVNFLPELYLLQGYIAGSAGKYDDAISINKRGLAAALEIGREGTALTFENNMGVGYIELKRYDEANVVLLQAQQRAVKLKDESSQQLIKLNLGFILVMEGQHKLGLEQMQASMLYFSKHAAKVEYEPYYTVLARAYAAAGLYQQQAETLVEQMALREEIRSTDREARLNELQNRYDTKAKSQQITILEQENSLKAQLIENKQLQQKLMFLLVLLILFAAVALLMLYRKVRRSNQKLYETNKQLAFQSQRDPLTGLYNRRALQQHMQLRSQKRRDQDASLTGLLLLDIDFFKRINDHYGHSVGDAVLIELSQRLLKTCREHDLVVRWGGEEILLVLEHLVPDQLSSFIERILQIITAQPVIFEQHSISVTASGGFIHLPFAGVSEELLGWEKVMQIVDMALYLSKANGRNQVCMINGLKVSFSQAEALLSSDLGGAIRADMLDITRVSGPGGAVN